MPLSSCSTAIFRWFVFYDIVLPEDPPDILFELYMFFIFDQHINLHWLFGKQMFGIEFQIFCLFSKLNLQCRVKCRMPLDFLIVCVQSCSHFMIIKCLVFFNAYKWFLLLKIQGWKLYSWTFICIEFFSKMESRAETAVKSEIIFYTTKRGLESADRNEIRMFATMKKLHNHNRICLRLWCAFSIEHSVNCVKYKPEFNVWTAACRWCYGFPKVMLYCMPTKCIEI